MFNPSKEMLLLLWPMKLMSPNSHLASEWSEEAIIVFCKFGKPSGDQSRKDTGEGGRVHAFHISEGCEPTVGVQTLSKCILLSTFLFPPPSPSLPPPPPFLIVVVITTYLLYTRHWAVSFFSHFSYCVIIFSSLFSPFLHPSNHTSASNYLQNISYSKDSILVMQ